jgi:cell division protein FtsA
MREMAEAILGNTVRIAQPEFVGLRDPAYVNGAGMILYVAKRLTRTTVPPAEGKIKSGGKKKSVRKGSPLEKVKNWLSEFI